MLSRPLLSLACLVLLGNSSFTFAQKTDPLKPVGKATEMQATALPIDSRVVEFPYHQDGIFRISTKTQNFTRLALAKGETVKGVYLSDTIQWEMHVAADKQNVFIKPIQNNISTTGTLITNKRSYDLELKETSTSQWHQRVTWSQPVEEPNRYFEDVTLSQVTTVKPTAFETAVMGPCDPSTSNKNSNYEVQSQVIFAPTNVWSDQKYTCLVLPSTVQEVPALFALDAQGATEIVDYKLVGNTLVVPRVMKFGALLKLGKEEVLVKVKVKS